MTHNKQNRSKDMETTEVGRYNFSITAIWNYDKYYATEYSKKAILVPTT